VLDIKADIFFSHKSMVSEQNGGTSFFIKDFNHLIHSLLAIHSCIDKNDTALLQICV
jgi:hypothetical protein